MNNQRNKNGVKDSVNCYLHLKGKLYTQWSDSTTLEDCQAENPQDRFIARKQKGFVRIYKEVRIVS